MEIKRLLEAIKKWHGQNQKRLRKEMIRKHDDIRRVGTCKKNFFGNEDSTRSDTKSRQVESYHKGNKRQNEDMKFISSSNERR